MKKQELPKHLQEFAMPNYDLECLCEKLGDLLIKQDTIDSDLVRVINETDIELLLDELLALDLPHHLVRKAEELLEKADQRIRKEGCECPKPLIRLCPGGKPCFTKIKSLKGHDLTRAILELQSNDICVCVGDANIFVHRFRKSRREKTPRCPCGKYFSNAEVRDLGLYSKSEWNKMGFKVTKDVSPTASVWRTVYWLGRTGGRISEVSLYSEEQVTRMVRRFS